MSSSPEHKRSSSEDAAAVAVTPEKPIKKKQRRTEENESSSPNNNETGQDDDALTAESIMGFPRYPNATNGEIMKHHYDFVIWAKKKKANDEASGGLLAFVEWVESPEGQRLELESEGNIKFSFGQHNGETFVEVAQTDPGYHERYLNALRRKGEEPNSVLSQYISWFKKGGWVSSLSADRRPAVGSPAAGGGGPPAAPRSSRVGPDINGSEKFSSGRHIGKTFRDVATEDPSYHLRCEATGYSPGGIERYRQYFARNGDQYAAARDERATIAAHLGFVPDCGCFD